MSTHTAGPVSAARSARPDAGSGAGDGRYASTRRITVVGIGVNLVLAAAKFAGGVLGQSQALVADAVHSLSDLVTDAVVLVAARQAARAPDADHPYGHGRIETAATIFVGGLLLLTAAWLARDAVGSITAGGRLAPGAATLAVALAAVAAKEALFRHTRRVARRIRSRLLEANAWHHRSDALSSVVVAAGIGGALGGFVTLDAFAAIVVALMVAKVGLELIWQSLRELVDTGLDDAALADLRRTAESIDGVRRAHTLRSRWMGHSALLDLHVRVGPRISVSEGHRIGEAVRLALLDRLERLEDVMVHVDPEDDTDGGPSNALPLRTEIVARLWQRWTGLAAMNRVEELTLHYLGGRVHLRVMLAPAPAGIDARGEAEALRRAAAAEEVIGSVTVTERAAPMECSGASDRTTMVQGPPDRQS